MNIKRTNTFRKLVWLQMAYAVMGILFNLVSQWRILSDLEGLTQTNPVIGILVMVLVALSAAIALHGHNRVFMAINLTLIILLTNSGVLKHIHSIVNLPPEALISSALVMAIGVNGFGVIVMSFGVLYLITVLISKRENKK